MLATWVDVAQALISQWFSVKLFGTAALPYLLAVNQGFVA
jgi:hypothetical protein